MKKITKLGILLGLSILLSNCDSMQDATQQEVRQENIMTKISFDEFKSKASLNGKAKNLIGFFDVTKSSFKSGNNFKSTQGFEDATILTESIIKIKQDDFTTYTFTILTQVEKNEFYNLVLYVNENQEIYKSHILKYTPSEKWLSDRTQDFSGNVKIISNDVFDVKNLLPSKTSSSAKTTYLDNCIDNVYITYACSNNRTGHREDPRAEGCDATEFYYYVNITYVPCSGTSGDAGGNFDPNTGSGTTTSGGGTSGIVTAPNTIPYTSQLKSFESGTLNATERTYYQGNSNIRNTIDTYLINYGFSNNAKLDSKSALAFSSIYKLNFPQFNWVFTYRASEDLQELKSYLVDIGETTPEIEGYVKAAINSEVETNNDANIDYEDIIINALEGKALCIYDKLMNSSAGFKNAIKNFDGEFPVSHLKLITDSGFSQNVYGETYPPVHFVTEIRFNKNSLASLSDLGVATVFAHEMIHAEIFRKMLSAAKIGSLENVSIMNALQQTNYVNSLKNNFPGLFDYYFKRYKPTWNHELMANHYRGIIADILQQFDNSRLSRSTYEAVAWVGLGKLDKDVTTIAWDNLSQDEKTAINILIRDNFYNGPSTCN